MAGKTPEVFISNNFKLIGKQELPSAEYLQRAGIYYDTRLGMLVENLSLTDIEWYANYLDTNAYIAGKNPSAYPTYLLDLGYIPIVYLPSCCITLGVPMLAQLDVQNIPYIKMSPLSFVHQYCNIDTVDAWVSKLDIHEALGIPVDQIKASDVARRLFKWENIQVPRI